MEGWRARREETPIYFYPSLSVPEVSPPVSASTVTDPVVALLSVFPLPIQCPSLLDSGNTVILLGPYSPRGEGSCLLGS